MTQGHFHRFHGAGFKGAGPPERRKLLEAYAKAADIAGERKSPLPFHRLTWNNRLSLTYAYYHNN
jgi:hypothetical protein